MNAVSSPRWRPRLFHRVRGVCIAVLAVGCRVVRAPDSVPSDDDNGAAAEAVSAAPSATAPPATTLEPSTKDIERQQGEPAEAPHERRPQAGLWELIVPGFEPALVSVPESARKPQPVLVAVHGAGDGPQWECRAWRTYLGDRGVVLCPAGRPLGRGSGGFYHPDHFVLERLVLAAVDALRSNMGDYVDTSAMVYAAYSQGATMGALMIVPHGEKFSRLILVEGGYTEWNVPRAIAFKDAGGQRVLFGCGTSRCQTAAARSVAWLEQAGLPARLETDLRSGHSYGGPLGRRLAERFDWVVHDDPRWQL